MYDFTQIDIPNTDTIALKDWYNMTQKPNENKTMPDDGIMTGFNTAGIDLKNFHALTGNFDHSDFNGTNIDGIDAQGCNFEYSEFNGCIINNGKLDQSIIRYGSIISLEVNNVTFTGAILRDLNFKDSNFTNCSFDVASLLNCHFTDCNFINCRFVSSSINDCYFTRCKLTKSFFRNTNPARTYFIDTYPTDTTSYPYALHVLEECLFRNGEISRNMGYYYKVFKEAVTWDEANEICKEYGGTLVSVDGMFKNNFLYGIGDGDAFWLGGTYNNGWKWLNGDPVPSRNPVNDSSIYANWENSYAPAGSANSRLYMSADKNGWGIADKSSKKYFVCEWKELGRSYDVIQYLDFLSDHNMENTPEALQSWLSNLPRQTLF